MARPKQSSARFVGALFEKTLPSLELGFRAQRPPPLRLGGALPVTLMPPLFIAATSLFIAKRLIGLLHSGKDLARQLTHRGAGPDEEIRMGLGGKLLIGRQDVFVPRAGLEFEYGVMVLALHPIGELSERLPQHLLAAATGQRSSPFRPIRPRRRRRGGDAAVFVHDLDQLHAHQTDHETSERLRGLTQSAQLLRTVEPFDPALFFRIERHGLDAFGQIDRGRQKVVGMALEVAIDPLQGHRAAHPLP